MKTFIAFIAATVSVLAQSAPAPPAGPTFDAVSIKRSTGGLPTRNLNQQRPDGGFTVVHAPIAVLIARAYPPAVPADMVGLPDWATRDPYDVVAASALQRATEDDRVAMLRAMLADRVKLAAHVEKRPHDVYRLVLARDNGKLGAGLTRSDADCDAILAAQRAAAAAGNPSPRPPVGPDGPLPPCTVRMASQRQGQTHLEGEGPLARVVTMLRAAAGRAVVDETGLTGNYHVAIDFDMGASRRGPDVAPPDNAGPSIFTAVQEQLGLKLVPGRVDQDTLVVDHIEPPTEN